MPVHRGSGRPRLLLPSWSVVKERHVLLVLTSRDDSGESFLAGQIFRVIYGRGQICTGEYVIDNYRSITHSYLVDLDLYRYLLKNRGVASRDYLYALPPRPRPPFSRPRSIAIARIYSEFFPSRRTLPSNLAGAVLVGIS
jgi:hypothetical protein